MGGWLAGWLTKETLGAEGIRSVGGNGGIPGALTTIQMAACRILDRGYWMEDTET